MESLLCDKIQLFNRSTAKYTYRIIRIRCNTKIYGKEISNLCVHFGTPNFHTTEIVASFVLLVIIMISFSDICHYFLILFEFVPNLISKVRNSCVSVWR